MKSEKHKEEPMEEHIFALKGIIPCKISRLKGDKKNNYNKLISSY